MFRKSLYINLVSGILFIPVFIGCKVNKIHCGAFSYNYYKENGEENGQNYIELTNGTKVVGNKINWKQGFFVKGFVSIDDKRYAMKEVRGYFEGGTYYGKAEGTEFVKRIIHGKLNVYYYQDYVETMGASKTMTYSRPRCIHFIQVGNNGELKPIGSQKDILKYVKDCPISVSMISKSNSQIRKEIKKNLNYLNNIFRVYNNDCKPLN